MAARSFFVGFKNFTGKIWDRGDVRLPHGKWSEPDGFPSEHIPRAHFDEAGDLVPGDDWFMSESDGFATGTEGFVEYTTEGISGTLRIHFNNPFVGSNEFTANGPGQFTYNWGDPGGSDANITLRIEKRS